MVGGVDSLRGGFLGGLRRSRQGIVTEVTLAARTSPGPTSRSGLEGGETDGIGGHVGVVREGERWLLDRYERRLPPLQHARLHPRGRRGRDRQRADEGLHGWAAREVGPDRIREIYRAGASGGEALIEALLPYAENCPAALAEYGADEFTEGLVGKGKSPAYVKCLHEELEGFLLLTDIAPELLGENPDFAAVAALEGIVTGAKRNCIGKD